MKSSFPGTHSVGPTLRVVTVAAFTADGQTAICTDRSGYEVRVPLFYQRAKGQLPLAGESWLLSQDTGPWTFQMFLGTGSSQFPNPTPAAPASFTPANPASTTSVSAVMMGLGSTCLFTPASTGNVLVTVAGTQGIATGTPIAVLIGGRYGTGSAPAHGAAASGTRFGWSADVAFGPNAATAYTGFAVTDAITGLAPGTAYWFDLAVTSDGTNTAQLRGVTMTLAEV